MPVGEVTAEWALWGEEELYSRYRVLSCSDGVLGQDVFRTVLTRYSPGTIASVPQVTVSWLSDRDGSYYLGMAIHDHSSADRIDTADREIIQTSYYCVPFGSLAAGAVSYSAMYERFRTIALPVPDGHPVTTTLATAGGDPGTPSPGAPSDRLAMRAASLLLTNRPVCILRAQNVSLTERLRFLDAVVALLPYGMRSQLSASTWASGTYREHKLRLFFGTSARDTDHPLTWGSEIDQANIDDGLASRYEEWLKEGLLQCVVQLAADTAQSGFGPPETEALARRLGLGQDQPSRPSRPLRRVARPASTWEPVSASSRREPARMLQPLRPTSASVDELLASCASRLAEKAPRSLQPEIDALRRHMTDRPSESDRARYCALITEHALLNDHAIGAAQRTDLHEVLLRLAFGAPLTYDSYCAVEAACSGIRGNPQPLPRHLAEIITERIGVDSVNLALLVLHGLDKQLLIDAMQALPHGELLAMAAAMTEDSRWLDGHAWAMCAIVTRYLTAEKPPTGQAGRDQLKTELRKYGFLAQALQKVSPDRCQYQLNVLEELLKAAYGRKLEQRDIREILLADKFAPTAALLAAVLRTAHPRHVKLAMWLFAGATLKEASFSYSAGDSLISLINTANDLGSDAHLQFNDRARRRSDRRARIASQQSQGQAESAVGIGPAPPRIRK